MTQNNFYWHQDPCSSRYLSKVHNSKINIVTHNKNVFTNNPYVNKCLSFDQFNKSESDIIYESFTYPGQKDGNGIEKKFAHFDVRQLHALDLGFQLPTTDLSYDFYPDPLNLDISLPEKYVVLHVTTNWPNRTWNYNNWVELMKWLKENNIFTVLIGFGYREELHNFERHTDAMRAAIRGVFEPIIASGSTVYNIEQFAVLNNYTSASIENKAIEFKIQTGDPTGGTGGTIVIELEYIVSTI